MSDGMTPISNVDVATGKIFVVVNGNEWQRNISDLGLNFDDSDLTIMDRISSQIQEEFNVDIHDSYKIRKSIDNKNIHIIPNSTAG